MRKIVVYRVTIPETYPLLTWFCSLIHNGRVEWRRGPFETEAEAFAASDNG